MWCDVWCNMSHALRSALQAHCDPGVMPYPKRCHMLGQYLISRKLWYLWHVMWCDMTCDMHYGVYYRPIVILWSWHFQKHVTCWVNIWFLGNCDMCDTFDMWCDVWCDMWHALWYVLQAHCDPRVMPFPKYVTCWVNIFFLGNCDMCDTCDMWYDVWCDMWHALWNVLQAHCDPGVMPFPKNMSHVGSIFDFWEICDTCDIWCDVWCDMWHVLWYVLQAHCDPGVMSFPFLGNCDICDMWCDVWHALWCALQAHCHPGSCHFQKHVTYWVNIWISGNLWHLWHVVWCDK